MTSLNRRTFLTTLAVCASGAGPADKAVTPDHITPETQKAIDKGLAYLARSQAADGSYGDRPALQRNVALTALGGLAFMAGGHVPGKGAYGSNVTRAIEFVLAQESRTVPGFLWHEVQSTHGPMYSHGFGTMFIAEAYGLVDDTALSSRMRATLERAVRLILNSQNEHGGWRYRPVREGDDVSVTICQIMALRSARNAGLTVPKQAADKCAAYVRACQAQNGGFNYFKQGGGTAFPRSAAGLCALYSAGQYQGREIDRALSYLKQFKPGRSGRREPTDNHYYYGHYYAAQAFWTAGEPHWSDWFPAVRDDLTLRGLQRSDGAWMDAYFGQDYATSLACITLQIPNNYLPILQK
ncbi:MAG: terpene cyclase/mutase family protein [Gemmataceae bacterium]|nr:terpene cyclase/mutase family protein [Gemmataceae bacterium]